MVRKGETGSCSNEHHCPLHPFTFSHIFSLLYSNTFKESTFWVWAIRLVSNICFHVMCRPSLKYIHLSNEYKPRNMPKKGSPCRGVDRGSFQFLFLISSGDYLIMMIRPKKSDNCFIKHQNDAQWRWQAIQIWQPRCQYSNRMYINNVSILSNSTKGRVLKTQLWRYK